MSATATLPCPFCGDTRPASIEEVPMTYDPPNLFVAACQCCGAQGPAATTRGAAIAQWDQRRAPGDTAKFVELAERLAGVPQHEDGVCPRDGEPCACAGNGKQCCGEKETY